MQKFGFVFPGQGSQKLGMLSELAASAEIVEQTFTEASAALDIDLWEVAQTDPNNRLDQTEITQPALLTASVAIWRLWQAKTAAKPSILAGHSLGEYSALVCAEVLQFEDAVKLVHQRGQFMQSAISAGSGKMAAIVGLDNYKINELCEQAAEDQVVSAANFNSPGQTVIAGDVAAVERAMALCKDAGAKRALPLNVSVPSHCKLMEPAADELKNVLDTIAFQTPRIPIVQNVDAGISDSADEIKERLISQLFNPVRWTQCLMVLREEGCTSLVECGPGKVLSGLTKRSEPSISSYVTHDPNSISVALENFQSY